jgi:ribose 5-phosphate isomerase RpiB
MRIAVVNEVSAVDKNNDIIEALSGRSHLVLNAGMQNKSDKPELLYTHTGFISALLLNAGEADFVVGGCGTGQGFLNSAMQYPGVVCGLILGPLDAWLFAQINAGNCLSLALNQGYGWAGNVNLRFIFDRLFSVERGAGYPAHRKEPQREGRQALELVSLAAHKPFAEIVTALPAAVAGPSLRFLRDRVGLDLAAIADDKLAAACLKRVNE